MAMASGAHQKAETVDPTRLGALLDKLVAVRIDLEPRRGTSADRPRAEATPQAITEACEVLYSAIADLRNIIHQIDGLAGLSPAMSGRNR
jgi:hypothetical protein